MNQSTSKQILPFGSWPSPITSQDLVSAAVRLGEPCLDEQFIYWIEGRPQEKGRSVLVRQLINSKNAPEEVLPQHCNVSSRAHEYGGASYTIAESVVYFIEAEDQQIYRYDPEKDTQPQALSPGGNFRYTDLCVDIEQQRLICVREDHRKKSAPTEDSSLPQEEINEIVSLCTYCGCEPKVLASGCDFYSNPKISTDGSQLSWISWNHPSMPWDSTQCWLADFSEAGLLENAQCIAGKDDNESIFQPQWSPTGELYLVSDRSNWWNLYKFNGQDIEAIFPHDSEFATPQWIFGMSTYGFIGDDKILACHTQNGTWSLILIDLKTGEQAAINNDCIHDYKDISAIRCKDGEAIMFTASASEFNSLVHYTAATDTFNTIARSATNDLSKNNISHAQPISFSSGPSTLQEPQQTAHGFYYPPTHAEYAGPQDSSPPLIVLCHGGPTSSTETGLNTKIQYWTTRGFAVMDVNYRGSTGYGRDYRQLLHNNWGITDIEDVCAAAEYLIEKGLADKDRIAIKGSSAGGYTVLAALTFADTFKAGASLYGIGDLETLARDTHKFEARYLDSLVGTYPEEKATYIERSPIHHSEQLNCPVIFFQGLDDKVVPPNQAEAMVEVLDKKHVPVAYVAFDGEGHGFRGADAITRTIDGELSFYSQVFGLELSKQDQTIVPIEVKNL